MTKPSPIACTLTGEHFKDRIASIQQLARDALQRVERRDLWLTLSYSMPAAARVRAMVRQEQECCGFLTFAVREDAGEVRVTITAPEEARAAADSMFEQLTVREPPASTAVACCGSKGPCTS
jgi:hypothetical protein